MTLSLKIYMNRRRICRRIDRTVLENDIIGNLEIDLNIHFFCRGGKAIRLVWCV